VADEISIGWRSSQYEPRILNFCFAVASQFGVRDYCLGICLSAHASESKTEKFPLVITMVNQGSGVTGDALGGDECRTFVEAAAIYAGSPIC